MTFSFQRVIGLILTASTVCMLVPAGVFAQSKTTAKTDKKVAADTVPVNNGKDYYLEMKGNVRQSKGSEKEDAVMIDSALVTIYCADIPYSEIWTNKKGKCTFKLPLDKTFKIQVSKNGYVTKFFEVNTKVPNDKKSTFGFYFDIDIFEEVKGLDV